MTLTVRNATLQNVMEHVLSGTGLTYSINNNGLVILSPLSEEGSRPGASPPVTGAVFNEKGEAMPGVTVNVKGKKTGTVTDANGRFSIEAMEGEILEISYIGYETQVTVAHVHSDLNIKLKQGNK